MAITYKSQGSGVSTETSAAALSPLCPATVDAGDILIAHVFWEGTSTAPSTPTGWTLLSGPHVIETTIARHWVFGKIASGSEDGAAVAFGAPAVTTQRAARVYSFAGRVAGTIGELIQGFTHQSNANDPTMPTVSTTVNGALAVALIAQNDNNAFASPTGESGGNWVEAVAEYTAALTPGFSIGIVTCTPTGDPGTVTGGTDNTTNDPAGVIGFEIKDNNIVGVGDLALAGLAPTVVATNNKNVTADVGVLTVSGFSPTVELPKNISASTGVLSIEGFAPSVSVTSNLNLSTDVGELTVSGFNPTIQTPLNIPVGFGELTVSGLSPVVSVSDNKNVTPGTGELTFEGFNPALGSNINLSVFTGVISIEGIAPTVNISISASPQTGEISLNGLEPTIQTPRNISSGLGEIIFNGFAPVIDIGGGEALIETETGLVFITGYAPNVFGGNREYLNIGSGIDNANLDSLISNNIQSSRIGTLRKKSKIDGI